MKTGIYKIENKINNKKYIGQSVNIEKRWREHRNDAFNSNCKDYNMTIYKAFRKYGLNNFSFNIIEECESNELNDKEVYWVDYFNSYYEGYNETIGGNESHIHLGRPVELYDMEGKYVKEYPNVTEAAKDLNISRNTIYQILYKKRKSAKNYQYKYKDDTTTIITKYNNKQGGKKEVAQCNKDGEIIQIFESIANAAKTLKIDSSTISKCCKGKLKTCGGFYWKYIEEEGSCK